MPEMDGFSASEEIRKYLKQDAKNLPVNLPIIAMTANAFPEDKEKCFAAGMDDHIAKPFERYQLETILEKWIMCERPVLTKNKITNANGS